jgi:hypothetical protein
MAGSVTRLASGDLRQSRKQARPRPEIRISFGRRATAASLLYASRSASACLLMAGGQDTIMRAVAGVAASKGSVWTRYISGGGSAACGHQGRCDHPAS